MGNTHTFPINTHEGLEKQHGTSGNFQQEDQTTAMPRHPDMEQYYNSHEDLYNGDDIPYPYDQSYDHYHQYYSQYYQNHCYQNHQLSNCSRFDDQFQGNNSPTENDIIGPNELTSNLANVSNTFSNLNLSETVDSVEEDEDFLRKMKFYFTQWVDFKLKKCQSLSTQDTEKLQFDIQRVSDQLHTYVNLATALPEEATNFKNILHKEPDQLFSVARYLAHHSTKNTTQSMKNIYQTPNNCQIEPKMPDLTTLPLVKTVIPPASGDNIQHHTCNVLDVQSPNQNCDIESGVITQTSI